MSGMFLTPSLVYLAKEAAGCLGVPAGECDSRVYGLLPSSLVPMTVVIAGLTSAFLMPVIGAIIDFTPFRRILGISASIILFCIQSAQIGTVSSTWFMMLILQAFAGVAYDMQNLASTAYFPDIGRKAGEDKTTKFQASFSMILFTTEFFYLLIVVGLGLVLKLDTVTTGQAAQALSALCVALALGVGWTLLPHVPALHKKPDETPLLKAGFSQLWRTAKGINSHYGTTLRWFFLATCFAEAGECFPHLS